MPPDRAARPEPGARRLFVAVEVPDGVRGLLASAARPLRERHPRARWVPEGNQHVTLRFLGRTRPRLVDRVTAAVAEVAGDARAFTTRIEGFGGFPNGRRACVLWAGLADPEGRLAALAGALDRALTPDFEPDERVFTPHLTLARFEPPAALADLPDVRSAPFEVDRIVLFESRLRRPAPIYDPVAVFPLGR
jgi:2'-5' RNA ligase